LSNDSSIGEKGLGKSDSSEDIVSDLLGHFCSTIAADSGGARGVWQGPGLL